MGYAVCMEFKVETEMKSVTVLLIPNDFIVCKSCFYKCSFNDSIPCSFDCSVVSFLFSARKNCFPAKIIEFLS